jgi:hypothetical protein
MVSLVLIQKQSGAKAVDQAESRDTNEAEYEAAPHSNDVRPLQIE